MASSSKVIGYIGGRSTTVCNVSLYTYMESSLPVELVPNLNRIAHGIELELELMQKNHENPSLDSNPSLELIQP